MKVIVTGSRGWTDRDAIRRRLALLPYGSVVVHGQSPGGGADLIADEEARALGHKVIPVPINDADRERAQAMGRPRFAPLARTERMFAEHPDAHHVEAFWDGSSPGTKHAIQTAGKAGKPVVYSGAGRA